VLARFITTRVDLVKAEPGLSLPMAPEPFQPDPAQPVPGSLERAPPDVKFLRLCTHHTPTMGKDDLMSFL
jgi:hypothetical protein